MKTKYKILIAKQIYNFLSFFLKSNNLIQRRNNITWNLNLDEAIDLHLFIFGNFENEIVNAAKKLNLYTNKKIIDIGANFGIQSLQFANTFKNSKIYSIEPTNFAISKFKKNLKLNQELSQNIFIYQYFLSNHKQKLPEKIFSSWNLNCDEVYHSKHYGIAKNTKNTKKIELDEFISKIQIKNVDFIKLDVDGNEFHVLSGGFNYLKKYKPPIFMELASYLYAENGYDSKDLIKLIKSLDYEFVDIKSLKKIVNIEEKIKKTKNGSSENVILI